MRQDTQQEHAASLMEDGLYDAQKTNDVSYNNKFSDPKRNITFLVMVATSKVSISLDN